MIPCTAETAKSHRRGLNIAYSHEQERAFPGYYGVTLPSLGITAELTATRRVGVHRYTFPDQQVPHILMHVTSALGKGNCKSGEVRILPEAREIEGSVRTFGTFSKRYGGLKVYFVARFNRPFHDFATRTGETETPGQAVASGDDLGVNLSFQPDDSSRVVELKLAISYVSIANARANLEHEAGKTNFDQVLTEAVAQWEEKLARIQIFGGSQQQRTIFRTALYHSLQMPTVFQDVNGEYLGFDRQIHQADGFNYYTDMSLWDTFRTVHPLFNLIARREQRDMIVSLVKMAEQGGYLPRWPSGGGYTGSMFGTPADIVIAESYLKGIRDFDVESAYRFMRKTALGPVPAGSPFSGRVGVEHYLKHEYCPADLMKKSVASTIEYGYADQAIARLGGSARSSRRRHLVSATRPFLSKSLESGDAVFSAARFPEKVPGGIQTGNVDLRRRHGKIHARVCRGERLAMALGRPFGCRGIGVAVQESRVLRAAARAVFRPLARRRRTEPECLLLARKPTRPLCRLSLQLCQPSRPDAEVGPVDSRDEVR